VDDCSLTPIQQFFRREQVNFERDDDEVRFNLDQRAELDFYSARVTLYFILHNILSGGLFLI